MFSHQIIIQTSFNSCPGSCQRQKGRVKSTHHKQANTETKCENSVTHVKVCRQPRATCFRRDKGNSLLLLPGHEASCRVGWMAPLPQKHLIFLQHAQTACNTALNCPLDNNACLHFRILGFKLNRAHRIFGSFTALWCRGKKKSIEGGNSIADLQSNHGCCTIKRKLKDSFPF